MYVCVVVDGYKGGKCVYDGENNVCVFSIYLGLLAAVIAFTLPTVGWISVSDVYVFISRFLGCSLSLTFLVSFSFSAHNWHDDLSGDHKFTVSARAALTLQFASSFLWVS